MMNNPIFIGRGEELRHLQNTFSDANNGLAKLVLISGNPGLGKSALVREFIKTAEHEGSCISAISECNDKEGLNSYAPFKDLLLKLNAAVISDSKEKKTKTLEKLKNFVSEAGTQWVGMIPVVGGFAQAGLETYKAYQNHFGSEKQAEIQSEEDIYRIFENEFRRLAEKKTLLIFLDDLQWADSSSLNLIFALGKSIRENPFKILIIGTYRPYDLELGKNKISETGQNIVVRHPLADKLNELRNYTKQESHIKRTDQWFYELALDPFNKDEVVQLIDTKFLKNNFPQEFYQQIFNLSDGQPLYLVEILDYLQKNNKIKTASDGSFYTENINLEQLPTSVQAIINEKVERLNDELKKVLSYASVSGEEFAVPVVEKLLKIDELDLLDYLEELSRKHGLLVANEPIQVKNMLFELYRFSQTLVHKYIYENLDGARRRALHRRIAETLKNIYGDELEQNKEVKEKYVLHTQIGQGIIDGVSLQLTEYKNNTTENESPVVNNYTEAAKAEIKLANESFEQYAVSECFDRINKALGLLSGLKEKTILTEKIRFDALATRNKAQHWSGHYQEALQTAIEMKNHSEFLKEEKLLATSLYAIGKAEHGLGKYESAITNYKEALVIHNSQNDMLKAIDCLNEMASSKEMQNLFNQAIEILNESLEYSENIDDETVAANTLWLLANNHRKKGAHDTAQNLYEHSLSIFKKTNNQKQIGLIYNSMGLNLEAKGEYYKAIEMLEKALEIAQNQNDKINISNRFNNIGLTYHALCDYDKALNFYGKTLEIDKSLNDKPKLAVSYNNIGSVYVSLAEYEKALEYFNSALSIYQNLQDKAGESYTYTLLAYCNYEEAKYEEAMQYIEKCIQINTELDDKVALGNDYLMTGNIYYQHGDYEAARKYYQKSASIISNTEDKVSLATININLGNIEHSFDNFEKAIEHYQFSYSHYQKTDDKSQMALLQGNMANTYKCLGEFEKSKYSYQTAIELFRDVNDNQNVASNLQSLGILYYNKGFYEESIKMLEASTEAFDKINNDEQALLNVRDIADAYVELNQNDHAFAYFKNSIEKWLKTKREKRAAKCWILTANLYHKFNDKINTIKSYQNAVNISKQIDDYISSIEYLLQLANLYKQNEEPGKIRDTTLEALETANRIQNPQYQAKCTKAMAWYYYDENEFDKTIEMCQETLTYHDKFNNDYELADTYYLIAEAMAVHSDLFREHQQIDAYLHKALEIYTSLNDIFLGAYCLNSLGSNYLAEGKFESALPYFYKAKEYFFKHNPEYDVAFINKRIEEAMANLPSGISRPGAV